MADEKPSLSQRIDDTIEGVLRFLASYLATLAAITYRAHRPSALFGSLKARPLRRVRPLTFLVIGAFLFALVIDVYPAGFFGLLDIIWFTSEIKESVREHWQEAISVTSLITRGLPTVIAIVSVGAISGRLLFQNPEARSRWQHAMSYAFGYQMAGVFLLFSLDSALRGAQVLLPLEGLPELFDGPIGIATLGVIAATALFVPLVLLVATALAENEFARRSLRIAAVAGAVVTWLGAEYLYPGVASILPTLKEAYFAPAKPSAMIFEDVRVERRGKAANLHFDLLLENPTDRDIFARLSFSDFAVVLSRGEDDSPVTRWQIDDIRSESAAGPVREVVPKESSKIVRLVASYPNWAEVCTTAAADTKVDRAAAGDGRALLELLVSARISVSGADNVSASQLLNWPRELPGCPEGGAAAR